MGFNIGPTIAVQGEKAYMDAMRNIRKEMQYVKASAEAVTSAYNANDKSVKALTARNTELDKALKVQDKAVKAAEAALARMKEQGIDPTSQAYKEMTTNLNYAQAALNKTQREIDENNAQLRKHGEALEAAGNKIKALGDGMTSVGKKMTASVTAPIMAAGTAATKFAMEFEDAMAKVSTLTGDANMDSLANQILDISDSMGQAASDLAEAQYQAISAGVGVAESAEFVATATKVAVGGFTDTTTAVDGLTTVMNAFGLAVSDTDEIANQFLITQNLGKTTVDELAKSVGQVAATANAAGVQTDELMASFAALTANGIQTSAAASGLKSALSNIIKPTSEAIEVANQLGIDFSVSALQAKGFSGFLDEIARATGGDVEIMGKLFGSTEALNSILTLTSDGGAALFSDAMAQMKTDTNAVDDAFNKVSSTSGYKLKSALNEVKNAGIKLGQKLTPVVEKIADVISDLADKFGALTDEEQKNLLKTAAIAAAVGPTLVVMGQLTSGVGSLTAGFGKLLQNLTSTGAAGAAAAGPGGWIALAVGAFVALGTAVAVSAVKNYEEFYSASVALKKANEEANQSLKDITTTFENTQAATQGTADVALSLIDKLDELGKMDATPEVLAEYEATCLALNELIPGLNITIDEQTGRIDGTTRALRDQITAWKDFAVQQAFQAKVTDLMGEYADIMVDVQIARNKLSDDESRAKEIDTELAAAYAELYKQTGLTYDEYQETVAGFEKGQTVYSEFGGTVAGIAQNISDLTVEQGSLAQQDAKLREEIVEGEKTMASYETQIADVEAAMKSLADGTYAAGFDAGSFYGKGLIDGLASYRQEIDETSSNLAARIDAATRKEIKARSPSKKAIQTAKDYGAGLVQGLESSKASVDSAAARLMSGMSTPTAASVSGAKSSVSSVVFNVTNPSEAWLDYAYKKFNIRLGAEA